MDYFGYNVDETTFSVLSGYTGRNNNLVWTCSGSGPQRVLELGARVKVTSGSSTVRHSIYDAAGNLVMQGSAAITVTGTSLIWVTHTAFVDVSGNPIANPTLTGGTNYIMCTTGSAGTAQAAYGAGAAGNEVWKAANYTAGYPATLGTGWNSIAQKICIRCGVIPQNSSFMPIVMNHFNRMRND
jgi:hypothetical protein